MTDEFRFGWNFDRSAKMKAKMLRSIWDPMGRRLKTINNKRSRMVAFVVGCFQ